MTKNNLVFGFFLFLTGILSLSLAFSSQEEINYKGVVISRVYCEKSSLSNLFDGSFEFRTPSWLDANDNPHGGKLKTVQLSKVPFSLCSELSFFEDRMVRLNLVLKLSQGELIFSEYSR